MFAHDEPLLLQGELQLQRGHDLLHDLILQGKDVLQRSVILLGPHVVAGGGVDQLRSDPYLLVGFLHTAFQHVAHPHLVADVLHFHRLAFVGEGRIAGDDKQTGDLGEIAGQHFGEAVAEVVLLGIATQIHQRQHDDGGFVGQRQEIGRWGLGVGCESWKGKVLHGHDDGDYQQHSRQYEAAGEPRRGKVLRTED